MFCLIRRKTGLKLLLKKCSTLATSSEIERILVVVKLLQEGFKSGTNLHICQWRGKDFWWGERKSAVYCSCSNKISTYRKSEEQKVKYIRLFFLNHLFLEPRSRLRKTCQLFSQFGHFDFEVGGSKPLYLPFLRLWTPFGNWMKRGNVSRSNLVTHIVSQVFLLPNGSNSAFVLTSWQRKGID